MFPERPKEHKVGASLCSLFLADSWKMVGTAGDVHLLVKEYIKSYLLIMEFYNT